MSSVLFGASRYSTIRIHPSSSAQKYKTSLYLGTCFLMRFECDPVITEISQHTDVGTGEQVVDASVCFATVPSILCWQHPFVSI